MVDSETTASPPVANMAAEDVCASDPNFALIFAFWDQFGEICDVVIPTFQELQEILEKTDEATITTNYPFMYSCASYAVSFYGHTALHA